MIETQRSEYRKIRLAFGPDVTIQETGPTRGAGQVEIRRDGALIGSGQTLARALADGLAFVSGGALTRASDLPTG